jgi:hypothetical protein
MADGFYVCKMEDGYAVKDQSGYNLKTAKTLKTCERYVQQQLETRRAAERAAIENTHKDKNKNCAI